MSIIALMVLMSGANVTYKPDQRGFWYGSLDFDLISEVEARRGGGFRGGGSRGFRSYSKPRSKPSSSKSSKRKNNYSNNNRKTAKPTAKSQVKSTPKKTQTVKPRTRFVNNTQRASSERKARASYSQTKAKFKKPVGQPSSFSKGTSSSKAYSNNKLAQSARNNDSRTYYSRRDSYYSGWNTPTYIYAGQPSYGLWDAMFLWHMMSTPTFGYHHANDSGYTQWRQEANELAKTNEDLKKQLAEMDKKIAAIDPNTKVDPNFLPKGVDSDIALSPDVMEAFKPEFRVCTGQVDGTYKSVGNLYSNIATNLNVKVVETKGSIENLQKINSGECDAALVQRDAYWVYIDQNPKAQLPVERISSPYKEYVHMVCNTGNSVEEVEDLTASNVLYVGLEGSGSEVTWNNFVAENSDYSKVKVVRADNVETRQKVKANKNACALYVGALGSDRMKMFNTVGDNLRLADVDDTSFEAARDPSNSQIYTELEIPRGYYGTIQRGEGDSGWFNYTETMTVPVDVVVSNAWAKANQTDYHKFVSDARSLESTIQTMISNRKVQ